MLTMTPEETIRTICRNEAPGNPCIGCTSRSCRYCPMEYENGLFIKPNDLRTLNGKRSSTRSRKPPKKRNLSPVSPTSSLDDVRTAFHISGEAMEYVPLPNNLFTSTEKDSLIMLQAQGDGMSQAGIHSGDYLVLDKKRKAKDGDIVAVEIDGEFVCRRLFFEGSKARIRREDGQTPDVITDNISVLAVYVGLIRTERGGT